jgi:hypothetical protein
VTEEITIRYVQDELETIKQEISKHLTTKFTEFYDRTGLHVTGLIAETVVLHGGFPPGPVDIVTANVVIQTDLGRFTGRDNA